MALEGLQLLRRLFRQDAWANRASLAALRGAADVPERAWRTFDHLLAAEDLWLSRILADGRGVVVWPSIVPEAREALLDELAGRWERMLAEAPPGWLDEEVGYVNSLGEPWRNSVQDVLLHVLQHSAYHRGQIASALRLSGNEPPYTDYIHAVRRGLLAE